VRQPAGVVVALALAVAACGLARAAIVQGDLAATEISDQLMLRLFGEDSDAKLSLAAAYGNRADESFLRGFALRVDRTPAVHVVRYAVDPFAAPASLQESSALQLVAIAPVRGRLDAAVHLRVRPEQPADTALTGAGQLASPPPSEPGSSALDGSSAGAALVSPSVRFGGVEVQGHVEGASANAAQLSLQDDRYGAGADFAIHAGRRTIDLDLTSAYERLQRNDQNAFSFGFPALQWQLPGQGGPFLVPSYADVNRLWVGATIGVPVRDGLTLNLNYGAQHLFGAYGLPGVANLDSVANVYGGGLTLAMPHSAGTLSISATQYRYADSLLPVNTSTQTNAGVSFTVKF
jgi:hypothetical protein